jgi:hypothetical protein
MNERWDDAAKRRNRDDTYIIRREIAQYLDAGFKPCRPEFEEALAAFDIFDVSEAAESDWVVLEGVLTRLQACTET